MHGGSVIVINPKLHQQNPTFAIDLFTKYAYDITYDDVTHALKRGIIIHNLERFHIVFDITYLHICSEIGIHPPYQCDTTHLKPDIVCLINECKRYNFYTIRSMIDNYGIVPNTTCLHEVCRIRETIIGTVKLLVAKGAKVDFECVEIFILSRSKCAIDESILREIKKKYLENGTIDFTNFSKITYLRTNVTAKFILAEFKKNYMKNNHINTKNSNSGPANHSNPIKLSPVIPDPIANEDNIKIQFVSRIPVGMDAHDSIYNRIPLNVCKLLGLTLEKNRSINYVEFRILVINHHKNSGLDSKIQLKKPFLYNGAQTVPFEEINEWVYSILSKKSRRIPHELKTNGEVRKSRTIYKA